mgnify:CR=1 FL=1
MAGIGTNTTEFLREKLHEGADTKEIGIKYKKYV